MSPTLAALQGTWRVVAQEVDGTRVPDDAIRDARVVVAHRGFERARVDGVDWYWPADEDPARGWRIPSQVRLLAPFDPVVWDRRRFESFWGWAYRFEAYTPAPKRVRPSS